MSEPTGSDAHPAFKREMNQLDLMGCPAGFQVIDNYGVVWTKTRLDASARWTSSVELEPGVPPERLPSLCGPIRRYQP